MVEDPLAEALLVGRFKAGQTDRRRPVGGRRPDHRAARGEDARRGASSPWRGRESRYVCQACAAAFPRWEGQCRACGAWNTLVETVVARAAGRAPRAARAADRAVRARRPLRVPAAAADVEPAARPASARSIASSGGGLVPGSSCCSAASRASASPRSCWRPAGRPSRATARHADGVLYASGEESAGRSSELRAQRASGLADGRGRRTRVQVLAEHRRRARSSRPPTAMQPALLVVDSIQTVTLDELEGPAGSVGQVRESRGPPRLRSPSEHGIAGRARRPRHQGRQPGRTARRSSTSSTSCSCSRATATGAAPAARAKNRFGSTEEVGVLEMTGGGLREVADPRRAFLGGGSATSGARRRASPPRSRAAGRCSSRSRRSSRRRARARRGARSAVSTPTGSRCSSPCSAGARGLDLGGHDVYASLAGGAERRGAGPRPAAGAGARLVATRPAGRASHGRLRRGRRCWASCARCAVSSAGCARRPDSASRRAIVPAPARRRRSAASVRLRGHPRSRTLREALDAAIGHGRERSRPAGHGGYAVSAPTGRPRPIW